MGCQTPIAQGILEGGGNYLLEVKDNQKSLHERLKELFSGERNMPSQGLQPEKEHGHVKARAHYVKGAIELEAAKDQ